MDEVAIDEQKGVALALVDGVGAPDLVQQGFGGAHGHALDVSCARIAVRWASHSSAPKRENPWRTEPRPSGGWRPSSRTVCSTRSHALTVAPSNRPGRIAMR